ncbi:PREDICTED: venom carboxylesterase-6-like [Nicrophorus vespilloides]|uniref:Carboxylic ester hydrolase n=1 Tax=Nicrophorus vespilloides TaxID=110193 RepID=A0ABM1M046_NICVS|nr:PREDICTED: venom carboxylesterase-6-like [Nicrophorus vespilloides]
MLLISSVLLLTVVQLFRWSDAQTATLSGNPPDETDKILNYARIRTVEIEIKDGKIRGRVGKTESRKKMFYGFRGLRYGEIPSRFEAAKPPRPWKGVYDATEDRASCIQIPESESGAPESEDCLYINVYTPKLLESGNETLLPVMFWIHGGAQMNGDSTYNYFGPDYFMEDDVVIVSLNFRIGVFGFLSTGDSVCPGNNGLKDIVLGMRWTQDNIRFFGGDPKRVTLFGESAGGAMAMYLAQSPLTRGKGYFSKVIAQSGNTLCPWSFQRNPRDVANRIAMATFCGLFMFDSSLMMNCLKTVDVNVLKIAGLGVFLGDSGFLIGILNGLAFAPNIEPYSPTAAVTEKSYELLSRGDIPNIPYIMGYNSEEALIVADNLTLLRPLLLQADAAPAILVPTDMHASFFDSVLNIATQIRNFYFDFAPITLNSNAKIIRYLSDHLFDRPTRESVSLISKRAPVYYYRFSYFGKLGLFASSIEGLGKVQHSAELTYMWRTNTKSFNNTDLSSFPKMDKLVRARLLKLWTNFARTGNPTPYEDVLLENKIWPEAAIKDSQDVYCMDIGEHLKVVKNPENSQYQMWKGLYKRYGKPSDTY